MPTLEEVQKQVQRFAAGSSFTTRGEIKALPGILLADERIEHVIPGFWSTGNGILVATDRRLIFVLKKLFGLQVADFSYDKVSSIQHETGMLMGSVTIFASGSRSELKQIPKAEVIPFCDLVRSKLAAP